MSRKYYDRLLVGTGSTSKEVKSKFGEKLMAKMGWSKGDGLGKARDGMVECIQIKRRDENLGMGAEMETVGNKFKWNDQFWDDAYNQMASKFSASAPKTRKRSADSFDSMLKINNKDSDSDSNSDEDSDSSFASFDGEIEIEKCSKPLLKLKSKKETNKKEVEKLSKSKVIKKDKKKKKKSKSD